MDYLKKFITVTEKIRQAVEEHCDKFGIPVAICEYYKDYNAFYGYWCGTAEYDVADVGRMLASEVGEFMVLPDNQGIVMFEI